MATGPESASGENRVCLDTDGLKRRWRRLQSAAALLIPLITFTPAHGVVSFSLGNGSKATLIGCGSEVPLVTNNTITTSCPSGLADYTVRISTEFGSEGVRKITINADLRGATTDSDSSAVVVEIHGVVSVTDESTPFTISVDESNNSNNDTIFAGSSVQFESLGKRCSASSLFLGCDAEDSLSRSGMLAPDMYDITVLIGAEPDAHPITANEHLNAEITFGNDTDATVFHWISTAGGGFGTAGNWNPAQVPTFEGQHLDTAIFDIAGSHPPISVSASGNSVDRLVIDKMSVDLNGSVQVKGTGSTGSPHFSLTNGGSLVLDNEATAMTTDSVVGGAAGAESSVFVSESDTKWTIGAGSPLSIGDSGAGKVVVDHDGTLDAQGGISVGSGAIAGTLRIESGARAATTTCALHRGSIEVRGAGHRSSLLNVGTSMSLAGGRMIIEDGGGVTTSTLTAAADTGEQGDKITVSGVDANGLHSLLSVSGSNSKLIVAGAALTVLDVRDGGALSVSGPTTIGSGAKFGNLTVQGNPSGHRASADLLGTLFVGSAGTASTITLQDGGEISVRDQMAFGVTNGESGSGTITGTGSVLSAGRLVVGGDGAGKLNLFDGALVQSGEAIVGQSQAAGPGSPTAPGSGHGSGDVTIQGSILSPTEWHITGNCFIATDEPGTLTFLGEVIGPFTIGGATVRIDGHLTIGPQGTLHGNGTLAIPKNKITNHGFISPGLSPGIIVIDGDFEQASDGTLRIELAGLDEGKFDELSVSGNATLDGTLEVHFLDGFLPKQGDHIEFLKADGDVTGNFKQVTFPELAPGFEADLALTSDGKLQLTARSDASTGGGATVTPPASLAIPATTDCGAGACGAGTTLTLSASIVFLVLCRRRSLSAAHTALRLRSRP